MTTITDYDILQIKIHKKNVIPKNVIPKNVIPKNVIFKVLKIRRREYG